MYPFDFIGRNHRKTSSSEPAYAQYLSLSSEPKENPQTKVPTFRYHNRYLAKRRLMRNLRRLRRDFTL